MRKVFTLLLLLVTIISSAQEKSYFNSNSIRISIPKLFDPINPGIEFSYERRFKKRFASQISGAYLFQIVMRNSNEFSNYRGCRFSFDEKYFFNERRNISWYLAVNFAYLSCKYNDVVTFEYGYKDTILIKKNTQAYNLKAGFNLYIHRFTTDISFGGGIKQRQVRQYDRRYTDQTFPTGFPPNIYLYADDKENKTNISVAVNIRIGYVF